ncbi:MAG: hypothetical protein AAFV53_31210 [Myxococcota bacterium]
MTLDLAQQRLNFAQALSSPCVGCSATCCTFLPLHDFQITRLQELDYALYLLNFDRIELAWLQGGSWRAHYRAPCTKLDLATRRCTVHGTDLQPNVCKRYDPYNCFYKRLFEGAETSDFVRMDRGRVRAWADMVVFDGHRDIVGYPDRDAALAVLPPLEPVVDPAIPDDPMLKTWEHAVRHQTGLPMKPAKTFRDFKSPCSGCDAYCCTRLSFPHGVPASLGNIDHLRFCLGFPGVEIGVHHNGDWTVVVRTRCKNLVDDPVQGRRCGVYGTPERPNACSIYDASMCGYKQQHGQPRPGSFVRVQHDDFDVMAALFHFDDDGYVLHRPSHADVRQAIEQRWANEGPLTPEAR